MKKLIAVLKKRRNGGFTLVEMIVSIALLAVLLGGMVIMIAPIIQSFSDNTKNLNAENVSTCINEYITKSIRYSNQVLVFTDCSYDEIMDNSDFVDEISKANDRAKVGGVNASYELRCISIKRGDDGKYYLYEEEVNTTMGGRLNTSASRKVFSDSLYNGLSFTADIIQPMSIIPDAGTGEAGTAEATETAESADPADPEDPETPKPKEDTLALSIKTYDENSNAIVFAGTGYINLPAIKFMLQHGGSKTEYFIKLHEVSPVADGAVDDTADTYIYYLIRRRTAPTP